MQPTKHFTQQSQSRDRRTQQESGQRQWPEAMATAATQDGADPQASTPPSSQKQNSAKAMTPNRGKTSSSLMKRTLRKGRDWWVHKEVQHHLQHPAKRQDHTQQACRGAPIISISIQMMQRSEWGLQEPVPTTHHW